MRWTGLLLGGTLALSPVAVPMALAQTEQAQDAHELARSFLLNLHAGRTLDGMFVAKRSEMIEYWKRSGKDEAQAAYVVDQFIMPEFRAELPDLLARFEDVLVQDYTPDELHSAVYDEDNAARQSARAKEARVQADFTEAGRAWGEAAGRETFAKNRAALEKLGFDEKAIAQ